MNKILSWSTGICLMLISSFSQGEIASKAHKLHSKILNEEREINVVVPKDYESQTNSVFPVLYRLDGKATLPLETAILNELARTGEAPGVIIVTIENTDRARDLAPTVNHDPRGPVGVGGGGDKFLDFIETELIPYVNQQYRTHDFKIFSGGSIGGLLVLHAMQSRPHLFQANIAYSPAVWWGDESTSRDVKDFFTKRKEYNSDTA